jgi:hypothetical protein
LRSAHVLIVALWLLSANQTCTAQGKNPAQANSGTSGSGMPGLSYFRETWNEQLTEPPGTKDDRILCYALVLTDSSTIPYTLQPTSRIMYSTGKSVVCSPVDDKHPLMMHSLLVIAIDARRADTNRIKLFNINVTSQSSPPLSPNPIRPSFGQGTSSSNLGEAIYFLSWPVLLQGDSNITVAVNLVYSPPSPGQRWQKLTYYPPGSIITNDVSGDFYITLKGGLSGGEAPKKWPAPSITDGTCGWVPVGSGAPPTIVGVKAYKLNSPFNKLDVVYVPTMGSYFVEATADSCITGTSVPDFGKLPDQITETLPKWDGKTTDGGILWIDTGSFQLPCDESNAIKPWKKDTAYSIGTMICNPAEKGREYSALAVSGPDAKSGDTPPSFLHLDPNPYRASPAAWSDMGPVAPASATNAAPAEQQISLLNQQLPQTHSWYYYNVSSGVFVSTIRSPSFGFAAGSSSTTNSGTPIQTGSSLIVDPVISLTRYVFGPFDAERKWRPRDLVPGLSLSFSLSSPTSNFYFGGSSEFQRYLQIDYGFALAKVPKLASGAFTPSTSATPATAQVFKKGAYIGISLNISGLIQGLTGGGGGKSGSSSSSPSQ